MAAACHLQISQRELPLHHPGSLVLCSWCYLGAWDGDLENFVIVLACLMTGHGVSAVCDGFI